MERLSVTVTGIVQGVGFRPYLHRLARQHGLTGWARNTGRGVELEWQGKQARLAVETGFDRASVPPLAVIEKVTVRSIPPQSGETAFRILPSAADGRDTLVSPDIAVCPDCLRELRDPTDRRYRYPFLNCTNCGPRFTIVRTVPYDRANTAMRGFAMCPACQAEYADIDDRRYHAQPDCCPACGPRLWFADASGAEQPGDAIAQAQAVLRRGGIVAVKGLGGFHLACTVDETTVRTLRARKHREEKPLAILCPDVAAARRFCVVTEGEALALQSPRAPIVLCRKQRPGALLHLSENDDLGVLLPYTPLHTLLAESFDALVLTSANLSDLPALLTNEEAIQSLSGIADGFLLHDRAIEARCDDSLLRILPDGAEYFIRRSRGYAPQPLSLSFNADGLLALGAEQKASFSLGKEDRAFYSQHIGDLKNAETLEHYEAQIARFEALFGRTPRTLVCDLHPDYLSTRYARGRGLPVVTVQHHHAHMAACMADNGLEGDCIGIVWDGTGLGTDGTIWGGEFLVGGYRAVRRAAALRPIPLPGGDKAIRQISRIAAALQWDAGLEPSSGPAALLLKSGVNCPLSSGMGRLFDGVYALLTGRDTVSYEGQGAVLLETLANAAPEENERYPVCLEPDEAGVLRFDHRPLIRALLADTAPAAQRAAKFHDTLAAMAVQVCETLRRETGLDRVVLSGGVFFNQILLRQITAGLSAAGFEVYRHHRVSSGDEGLALGQLAVAAHQ